MFNLNIDKDNIIGSRWQELNASHKKELDKNGFKYFRENIAKHYMTDNPGWKGDHIYLNDESGIEQLYQYLESIGVEIDISDAQIGGGMYMEDHNDN